MITHKTKWLLVGLVCLALWPAHPSAQGGPWETYMAAGDKAYQQGNYPEAEKQLVAALKEAEGFGPQDPRLATSFNNLALAFGSFFWSFVSHALQISNASSTAQRLTVTPAAEQGPQ